MKMKIRSMLAMSLALAGAALMMPHHAAAQSQAAPHRPKGPCDIYAAAGDPCVAAFSTTRALYASYKGPLYQVVRQSDGKALNIGVVEPGTSPVPTGGGYADAAAQDRFCANTYCWITEIYDQSGHHNNLTQSPRGAFSGPAMGGFNNVPVADMAPAMVMGHKVYGVFIEPGMGLRDDDPSGTAVDDQAEGQYWVVNGKHFNSGCCFDFGNAEIDSHDDDAGTMETAYFGDAPYWYRGSLPGPWVMTDQENNLVGCVNSKESDKFCAKLPNIPWQFVTGIAKGEAHHWTSMGGNAEQGRLSVMFSGPRVGPGYDPMRKQGAIVLGNGGDNSNGSQGTFYEGVMTAAGTFPTNATDQRVQANIVAAQYRALPLSLAPADATAAPPGLQTFSPGSSQMTTLTFTNTTSGPVADVKLSLGVPSAQWKAVVPGSTNDLAVFAGPIAPGARQAVSFDVTSGQAALNGDLLGKASWTDAANGTKHSVAIAEKVRNVSPIRINEFRINSGPPNNSTNSFIELYNSGGSSVNLSGWTLTEHPAQHVIFSDIRIPAGTELAPHHFYLLGLANSGLAAPAAAGSSTIYVRSTAGMKPGDTVVIGTGAGAETRTIKSIGTAARTSTTVWEPLPEGPVMTIPRGSTDVPVADVAGFVVGQKIALGYGATYPTVPAHQEHYEVATVTAVGKPGSQNYLAAPAAAGSRNIKVTSVADISVGDRIRLDIDSVGHGIETVTVTHVGTGTSRTRLAAAVDAGATSIRVANAKGFATGNQMNLGSAPHQKTVTITGVDGAVVHFKPALTQAYGKGAQAEDLGTGLELAAPLRFNHSSNLPFSDNGTGIHFQPATEFAHISNEPIQALGTGIVLSSPLSRSHGVNAVVRDAADTAAGYQGTHAPNQWFGGPALSSSMILFGRFKVPVRDGSMVLRNASGLVVDSLNYGELVDPWAAEGYQAGSGLGKDGCFVTTPGAAGGFGPFARASASDVSAGRFPDGYNTDSNCTDFLTSPDTHLAAASAAGATNIKVASVAGFSEGQAVRIGSGAELETAVIASVGTPGATTVRGAVAAGATVIPVANAMGFSDGQTITIGSGADQETAVVVSTMRFRNASITVASPLAHAQAAGAEVAGSGITLSAPLAHAHGREAQVTGDIATPGAPNQYSKLN